MRYLLPLLLVTAGLLLTVAGCNTPPSQSVEMAPADEPVYANDKPRLEEIRPVDDGGVENGDVPPAADGTTPTLSQTAKGKAYVVRKGDTYWRIAAEQLGNGHRWKEIEALNPNVNMNALKVGQTIRIPVK